MTYNLIWNSTVILFKVSEWVKTGVFTIVVIIEFGSFLNEISKPLFIPNEPLGFTSKVIEDEKPFFWKLKLLLSGKK